MLDNYLQKLKDIAESQIKKQLDVFSLSMF